MRATEAARMLGVHRSTIGRMARRGELTARPDPLNKRVLLVDRAQVEQLAAEARRVHGEPED